LPLVLGWQQQHQRQQPAKAGANGR